MIEIKNVTKSFDGKTILHDISATFHTGKTNLIIGQSGSGKTVLMKSIVGLLHPEFGQILYDGKDLLQMSGAQVKALRSEIGMLISSVRFSDRNRKCHVPVKDVYSQILVRTDKACRILSG